MLENLKQFEITKEELLTVYGGSTLGIDEDDDDIVDGTVHV